MLYLKLIYAVTLRADSNSYPVGKNGKDLTVISIVLGKWILRYICETIKRISHNSLVNFRYIKSWGQDMVVRHPQVYNSFVTEEN